MAGDDARLATRLRRRGGGGGNAVRDERRDDETHSVSKGADRKRLSDMPFHTRGAPGRQAGGRARNAGPSGAVGWGEEERGGFARGEI